MKLLFFFLLSINAIAADFTVGFAFDWPTSQASLPYPDRYSARFYYSTNMETMQDVSDRYFKWYGSPMGTFFVTFTERMTGGNTKPQDLRMLKPMVPVTTNNGWHFLCEVKWPATNFTCRFPMAAVVGTYVDRWTN